MIKCRNATGEDLPFLKKMLYEAVFWSRSKEDKPNLAYKLYLKSDFKVVEDIEDSYLMVWNGL